MTRHSLSAGAVASLCFVLGGCATIGDLPPDDIQNVLTAKERITLGRKAPCARPCASPIFAARAELEILLDELPELGETRVKASQSFGELSFWGALAGVIGAVTKHNAVLNIGAGTAAFGAVVPQRYKTEGFVAAFDRAEKRSRCLRDAVRGADDNMLEVVAASQTTSAPAVQEVVRDIRENLLSTVNDIRDLLRSEIRHNRPDESVSGSAIFEAYQKAGKASAQAVELEPKPASQEAIAKIANAQRAVLGESFIAALGSRLGQPPPERAPAPSPEQLKDYTDRLGLLSGAMKSCLK